MNLKKLANTSNFFVYKFFSRCNEGFQINYPIKCCLLWFLLLYQFLRFYFYWDLSTATTFNPHLFSLVNIFKYLLTVDVKRTSLLIMRSVKILHYLFLHKNKSTKFVCSPNPSSPPAMPDKREITIFKNM